MRRKLTAMLLTTCLILVGCGGGGQIEDDADPTQTAEAQIPASQTSDTQTAESRALGCPMSDEPLLYERDFREAMYCTVTLFPWPPGYQVGNVRVDEWVESHEGWDTAGWNVEAQYQLPFSRFACVWELEYLYAASQGNVERKQAASDALQTYVAYPARYIPGFPADAIPERSSGGFAERAKLADMGDLSAISEHARNNCTGYDYPDSSS